MKTYPHLTACPLCDSIYRYRPCTAGTVASCERCRSLLWQGESCDIYHLLPLTLAAAIVFSIACIYPVMGVTFHGLTNEVTLWQAAWALSQGQPFPVLALCAVFLLIVAPFLQITLLVWLLLFALCRRPAPAFIIMMKILSSLRPWSMMEVGMLGFLIAAVKLSSLLEITPAPGGWALAASSILIIMITRHDLRPLWNLVPVRENNHHE